MSSPSNSELSSSIEALSSKLSNPLPPLDDRESTLPSQLASIIDHTLLAPTATKDDIKRVCKEAIQLQAATVCVNSSMIPTAVEALKGTQVLPISVVGFPFGAMESDSKAQEAKTAVQQGAKEIDMVINLGFLLSSDFSSLYQDVSKVVEASSPQPVKVILESSLLNRSQLISASYISCLAGAKFLKTSTGYALPPSDGGWGKSESNDRKSTSGAQKEDVRLMYEIARSRDWGYGYEVEIKASGGIRSLDVVREMWRNGATRVGASGTKKILDELELEKNGKKVGSEESKGDGY